MRTSRTVRQDPPAPSTRKRTMRNAKLVRKEEQFRLTQALNASQPGT